MFWKQRSSVNNFFKSHCLHVPAGAEERRAKRACGRNSDPLGDGLGGAVVVLARLLREAEECEEGESAKNCQPTAELQSRSQAIWRIAPNDGGDLVNTGKVSVCIGPSFPGGNIIDDSVEHERVDAKTDSAEATETGQTHETDISVVGEIRAGKELIGLLAALVEC